MKRAIAFFFPKEGTMNQMGMRNDERFVARCLADDRSDFCEHVDADRKLAVAVLCEDDSFGPVGRFVVCSNCLRASREAEAAEMVCCADCLVRKPRRETREWKWYDFYAPQGDEPRCVCKECWKLPMHQERMADDRAAEKLELDGHKAFVDEYDS